LVRDGKVTRFTSQDVSSQEASRDVDEASCRLPRTTGLFISQLIRSIESIESDISNARIGSGEALFLWNLIINLISHVQDMSRRRRTKYKLHFDKLYRIKEKLITELRNDR